MAVDEVFLDFAKAFDKVPHQRLLCKLEMYGIKGDVLSWIESFLLGRNQRVKVGKSLSNPTEILSGVTQGSVLGPLLFLVFINDLPLSCSHSTCSIFADDTKVYRNISNVDDADKLQSDLTGLMEWCKKWKMTFNPSKCHVMHYGKSNRKFLYHLNGCLLDNVEEEKDLGVIIPSNLLYQSQMNKVISKATKIIAMIKNTFSHMDKDIFLMLYKVYVRPILEYGQEIWSPHFQKDIDMLEKVQRRATKIVPSLKDQPYEKRLKDLGLYSLKDRRDRGDMISVFKIMNNLIDLDISKLFTLYNGPYNTRGHSMKLDQKRCHTDIKRFTFSQRIIGKWNTLPEYVIGSKTVDTFKKNYDMYKGL